MLESYISGYVTEISNVAKVEISWFKQVHRFLG